MTGCAISVVYTTEGSMNKINIELGDIKISCEEASLTGVLLALKAMEVTGAGTKEPKADEVLKETEKKKETETQEPDFISGRAMLTIGASNELMYLMSTWNRLHMNEISIRGRRFSEDDKKLLGSIALRAQTDNVPFAWVALNIRVCPASIHRGIKWISQ